MIPYLCLMSLSHQHNFQRALYWAERLYNQVIPYPKTSLGVGLSNSLDAFEQVEKVYGHSPKVDAGIGNCQFYLGNYSEAVSSYLLAGRTYQAESEKAMHYKNVKIQLQKHLHNQTVFQIILFDKSSRGVAMYGKPIAPQGWVAPTYGDLAIRQFIQRKATVRWIGTPEAVRLDDPEDFQSAQILQVALCKQYRQPSFCVYQSLPAGDSEPSSCRFYTVTSHGLKFLHKFEATYDNSVYGPTSHHCLLNMVALTWKVGWNDVYEWNGKKFIFGNRHHPSLYPFSSDFFDPKLMDIRYPTYLWQGAIYDIHGEYKKAEKAWKQAIIQLRLTIKYGGNIKSEYRYPEFYGPPPLVIKEVKKRLRWLRHKDYNHILLYRPYDFDLQVPPYRLGNARGTQEQ